MTDLFKAISNNSIPFLWVTVFGLLIPFFWSYSKFKHRRYRNNILFFAFLLCLIRTFQVLYSPSVIVTRSLYILCGAYLFIALRTANNLLFPESSPIFRLENLIREGNYDSIKIRFPQKPFYIQSTLGRMKWHSLCARKLIAQDRPREAYEIYSKLLTLPLFDEEEIDIKLKRIHSLLLLGDTNAAQHILERIQNKAEELKPHNFLYLQSLFYERCGEFEKARHNLLSAIGEQDSVQDIETAKTYNDLGRMERMLGNTTNVIHYYRKAAELACSLHDKNLIHITYPNIIDCYLLNNDNNNATYFFSNYSELIDKENIDDLFKFNNYSLEYARQTKNPVFLSETLERGRIEILPKLTEQERYEFEISDLRIKWNNHCGWDEQLFWLSYHLPEYLKLEFPSRYYLIKEIFIILQELAGMNHIEPFGDLFLQLLQFMGQSKQDIDQYLINLPDYCVAERCFWEKEKAFLRRIQKTNKSQKSLMEFCEGLFEHLDNIKDIQLQHGNPLAAIEADLNVADECMALAQAIQEETIKIYLENNLEKHLNQACSDLEQFRGHPISNEYSLRIAKYALFVNNKEKAKKYFDYFVQSKIDELVKTQKQK